MVPTGLAQLNVEEACAITMLISLPGQRWKFRRGKVDLQFHMREIQHSLCALSLTTRSCPSLVEKYIFLSQETHEVPSAVVLSWSDNNSIILSFRVTIERECSAKSILLQLVPAKHADLSLNQVHAFASTIN